MAIDIKKMKAKLAALSNKGSRKDVLWSPKEGQKYTVRILPVPDGDPFKEFWFHYDLAPGGFLCPKKNYGEACAACEFASKLYKDKTEESAEMARKFVARQRFFSPIVVRGEEKEGVKVWGYGKTVYQDLLGYTLNPEYDDITDVDRGTDLNVTAAKNGNQSFASPKLTPARMPSKLCQGSIEDCKELLESIPDIESLQKRKTSAEVSAILDQYLSGDSTEEEVEESSQETVKYASQQKKTLPKKEKNPVDDAFEELMNS
jgi:hypothetical protein